MASLLPRECLVADRVDGEPEVPARIPAGVARAPGEIVRESNGGLVEFIGRATGVSRHESIDGLPPACLDLLGAGDHSCPVMTAQGSLGHGDLPGPPGPESPMLPSRAKP